MNTYELAGVAMSGLLSVWDGEGRVHLFRLGGPQARDALLAIRGHVLDEEREGGVAAEVPHGHRDYPEGDFYDDGRW